LLPRRVLAGTIRKTGDEDRDLALAASLAKSSKDLEEHEYAVRSVADALEPFCSSTNVPESPFVLHLSNVNALGNRCNWCIK
jgi:menaquinone-specific isochorismate synthase